MHSFIRTIIFVLNKWHENVYKRRITNKIHIWIRYMCNKTRPDTIETYSCNHGAYVHNTAIWVIICLRYRTLTADVEISLLTVRENINIFFFLSLSCPVYQNGRLMQVGNAHFNGVCFQMFVLKWRQYKMRVPLSHFFENQI